jgi:hypothetical protein
MTTCIASKPINYPAVITFTSNDFGCDIGRPQILPITIVTNGFETQNESIYNHDISIGNPGDTLIYHVSLRRAFDEEYGNIYTESVQTISGIGPSKDNCNRLAANINATVQQIVFSGSSPSPNVNSYVRGDTYTIDLLGCSGGQSVVKITFFRPNNFTVNSDVLTFVPTNSIVSNNTVSNNKELIEVPRIHVTAQTTIDGSDISNAYFNIYDKYTYYEEERLCSTKCKNDVVTKVCETIYNENSPFIVTVLKGKGLTAQEKVIYLAKKCKIYNSYNLYYNIILYSMAKYVLSRILYGTFDIKYLLGKYNAKFLDNLKHSRFCKYLAFFETNDYNKYFKYDF